MGRRFSPDRFVESWEGFIPGTIHQTAITDMERHRILEQYRMDMMDTAIRNQMRGTIDYG